MTVPTVLVLHAFPLDHRLWSHQAAVLAAAGCRVVVPDLPGFGRTDLPDASPSLDVVADVVLAQLDDQGIDRCVLGGVSLGGYVAMAMLRKRPGIASAVVLCGTKATADGDQARANRERLAQLVLDSPQDCARILEQAVLPALLGTTTHETRPHVVAQVRDWLADAPADTVAWYQRAMAQRPDSLDVLDALDLPAIVVWGEEDALSARSEQDLMLGSLRRGRLAVLESAGHLALVERPDTVSGVIGEFVATVTGQPSS